MSDRDAVIPPATQRISRRHLIALSLATLSVASLAACTGDTTPSRAANSQTGGPATEPAANGVFSAVLADYSLTGVENEDGSLIIRNAPLLNQPNWALLGEATSDGPDNDTITTLVWSGEPLAWDALGVSLE